MSKRNIIILGSSIFLIIFIVSLVIFITGNDDIQHRVLFFPNDNREGLVGERRKIKASGNKQKDVEILVKELLLGPSSMENNRFIPKGTKARTVILRDDILYLDFSTDILKIDETMPMSLQNVFNAIEKTIVFNFKYVNRISFTVDGEIPEFKSFSDTE